VLVELIVSTPSFAFTVVEPLPTIYIPPDVSPFSIIFKYVAPLSVSEDAF